MPLRERPLDSIHRGDLQELVDAQIPEGRDLEYKRELPGGSDGERKEFLADVSSFANAAGGMLLYGVEDRDGTAVGLPGIPNADVDTAILRLDAMVQDGIEERIPGVRAHAISVSDTHSVVALKVPRSWAGPHMVVFKGTSRFFGRNSRGKYQLDLPEIRRAFEEGRTIREGLQRFRVERIASIVAGETPVPLYDGPKMILHFAPLSALAAGPRIDIAGLDPYELRLTAPRSDAYHDAKYNFDGLAVSPPAGDQGVTPAYAQLFRNGIVEGVSATLMYEEAGQRNLYSLVVEPVVIESVGEYARIAGQIGLEPPYAVILSLTGVEGYRVIPDTSRHWNSLRNPFDRDILLLPEIVVESGEFNPSTVLRPIFDVLWQSAGWPRSMNYEEDGTHRPTANPRR